MTPESWLLLGVGLVGVALVATYDHGLRVRRDRLRSMLERETDRQRVQALAESNEAAHEMNMRYIEAQRGGMIESHRLWLERQRAVDDDEPWKGGAP